MATVPTEKVAKEQASALLRLASLLPFAKQVVGVPGAQGIRFVFFGLVTLESYSCHAEPVLEPYRGLRYVLWKTITTTQVSKGWRRFRGVPIGNSYAVAEVHQEFLKDWAGNARRFVSGHQEVITVRTVSVEEFAKAYHASGYLDPFLRYGFVRVIKDHLKTHPEDVSILCFFTKDNQLAGGTVFVDYPDIRQSHYLISFLTEEGRRVKAGYAFIHWWYQDMLKKNLRWADFGIVWAPGDPLSWKGYSEFKKRFHPQVYTRITYWKRG